MGSNAFEMFVAPMVLRVFLIYLAMAAVRLAIVGAGAIRRHFSARALARSYRLESRPGRLTPAPALLPQRA